MVMNFDYLHPDCLPFTFQLSKLWVFLQFSLYWCLCNIKNVADFASVQARVISRLVTIKRKEKRAC